MTQAIAKYAAKKMLSSEMNKYKSKPVADQYDPFYQMVPHPRKEGKMRKVKRQVPAYIPAHDADILARARKSAYRLDYCLFNFFGIRFGWSSVIGLVPIAGDGLDALLALNLILKMNKVECGLPYSVLITMGAWLLLDFGVGLVPFVGDLVDASIKCNSMNVRLLEQHLDKVYKPQNVRVAEEEADNDPSRVHYPRSPATVYEDFSDEEEGRQNTFDDRNNDVRKPTPAYSSRRDRLADEEMAISRQDTRNANGTYDATKKSSSRNPKSSRR